MIDRRTLATSLLLTQAFASGAARSENEDALSRIRRTKMLRIGAVSAQPPYCWKDVATGEWRGFLIDMGQALASELGVALVPVESTWGAAVLEVQAGKVDVFLGLAPTPQRALAVDFTRPFYQNAFALIARPGFDPKRWADLDDPAVRVALELGTQYDQAVPELCPKATVTKLRTNNDALLMVQAGRADCQILVVIFALTALTKNPALGHLVVPEPMYGATTNAMVAKEADPQLRAFLDGWIDERRKRGEIRASLVRNLGLVGVPAAAVPSQLLF